MAPQNSTLIQHHEYVVKSSSSLLRSVQLSSSSSTITEINRYSPILPLKQEEDYNSTVDDWNHFKRYSIRYSNSERQIKKSNYCKDINKQREDEEIPIWICGEPRFVSGITLSTTCKDIIQALINDEIENVDELSAASLSSPDDYVITERWNKVERILADSERILPLYLEWGVGKNEVKFRLKIKKKTQKKLIKENDEESERKCRNKKEKLNFFTKILKRILRQGETIQNQLIVFNDSTIDRKNKEKIKKYMNQKYGKKTLLDNFLINATTNLDYSVGYKNNNFNLINYSRKKSILPNNPLISISQFDEPCEYTENDDDELLLIIENNNGIDSDSGVHMEEHRTNHQNKEIQTINNNITKVFDLYEKFDNDNDEYQTKNKSLVKTTKGTTINNHNNNIKETPKRKFRSKCEYDLLKQHLLNNENKINVLDRFNNKTNKTTFDIIRYEIYLKMADMKKLYKREEELSNCLLIRCAKYKEENEIYNTKIGLEMCIEEVQKNLEIYTKEIIQNEQDLFRTKMEIEEKCRILDDLREMLKMEDSEEDRLKEIACLEVRDKLQLKTIQNKMSDVDFVDNIYEFCDNNESMIV